MKRYLIPILIILVLALGVFIGCNNDYEQRLARLEQQAEELSNEKKLEPKVIEKDIEIPNSASLVYYWLPFNLKAGDRVEGEVSITFYDPRQSENRMYGKVKDPYENILVETSHINVKAGQVVDDFPRVNPWRFAFIASTNGEYELGVSVPTGVVNPPANPVAHVKIVQYTSN